MMKINQKKEEKKSVSPNPADTTFTKILPTDEKTHDLENLENKKYSYVLPKMTPVDIYDLEPKKENEIVGVENEKLISYLNKHKERCLELNYFIRHLSVYDPKDTPARIEIINKLNELKYDYEVQLKKLRKEEKQSFTEALDDEQKLKKLEKEIDTEQRIKKINNEKERIKDEIERLTVVMNTPLEKNDQKGEEKVKNAIAGPKLSKLLSDRINNLQEISEDLSLYDKPRVNKSDELIKKTLNLINPKNEEIKQEETVENEKNENIKNEEKVDEKKVKIEEDIFNEDMFNIDPRSIKYNLLEEKKVGKLFNKLEGNLKKVSTLKKEKNDLINQIEKLPLQLNEINQKKDQQIKQVKEKFKSTLSEKSDKKEQLKLKSEAIKSIEIINANADKEKLKIKNQKKNISLKLSKKTNEINLIDKDINKSKTEIDSEIKRLSKLNKKFGNKENDIKITSLVNEIILSKKNELNLLGESENNLKKVINSKKGIENKKLLNLINIRKQIKDKEQSIKETEKDDELNEAIDKANDGLDKLEGGKKKKIVNIINAEIELKEINIEKENIKEEEIKLNEENKTQKKENIEIKNEINLKEGEIVVDFDQDNKKKRLIERIEQEKNRENEKKESHSLLLCQDKPKQVDQLKKREERERESLNDVTGGWTAGSFNFFTTVALTFLFTGTILTGIVIGLVTGTITFNLLLFIGIVLTSGVFAGAGVGLAAGAYAAIKTWLELSEQRELLDDTELTFNEKGLEEYVTSEEKLLSINESLVDSLSLSPHFLTTQRIDRGGDIAADENFLMSFLRFLKKTTTSSSPGQNISKISVSIPGKEQLNKLADYPEAYKLLGETIKDANKANMLTSTLFALIGIEKILTKCTNARPQRIEQIQAIEEHVCFIIDTLEKYKKTKTPLTRKEAGELRKVIADLKLELECVNKQMAALADALDRKEKATGEEEEKTPDSNTPSINNENEKENLPKDKEGKTPKEILEKSQVGNELFIYTETVRAFIDTTYNEIKTDVSNDPNTCTMMDWFWWFQGKYSDFFDGTGWDISLINFGLSVTSIVFGILSIPVTGPLGVAITIFGLTSSVCWCLSCPAGVMDKINSFVNPVRGAGSSSGLAWSIITVPMYIFSSFLGLANEVVQTSGVAPAIFPNVKPNQANELCNAIRVFGGKTLAVFIADHFWSLSNDKTWFGNTIQKLSSNRIFQGICKFIVEMRTIRYPAEAISVGADEGTFSAVTKNTGRVAGVVAFDLLKIVVNTLLWPVTLIPRLGLIFVANPIAMALTAADKKVVHEAPMIEATKLEEISPDQEVPSKSQLNGNMNKILNKKSDLNEDKKEIEEIFNEKTKSQGFFRKIVNFFKKEEGNENIYEELKDNQENEEENNDNNSGKSPPSNNNLFL